MGIYETTTMLAGVRKMMPLSRWFASRYFPDGTVFPTQKVLIEYKKGNRKMAPFVIPRKGGITVEREGYTSMEYMPPYIAPQRALTIDDLNAKGFGENLYTTMTPQQRQAEVLGEDLSDLSDMIDRRHEWMCREIILKGEVIMKHYAEKYGVGTPVEKVLRFYDSAFENEYTPVVNWGKAGCDIYGDLESMVEMLVNAGCPATDLNMSTDVYREFLKDNTIKELLNNRRMELGQINPKELPNGVTYAGTIVIFGKTLDIFIYAEQFEDEDGVTKTFMPGGTVFIGAPNMGETIYGAISQLEVSDGQFHTYTDKKVPKYLSDSKSEVREVRLASAPIPKPIDVNAWVVANVIGE